MDELDMKSMVAYLLTQTTEPLVASKQPFKVQLKAGKRYSWCACGHSKKQPFCDGTHKMLATKILPLRFVPDQDCTVWLCGCKHSGRAPYCDGTHKQDFIQKAELPTAPQS
ncbi:hypothetical protein MATL_G00021110 [Megalops atlanticus]|uniref:Iron-binding zinc finger CDGSH type domain-containing protein n=1 Tax=Megalops atlanticus TaxID=7932 RepID=A0A9D3QIJ7_MEGAT|nr:hypothetical protein MATL_G00021110 [Megalops atlanticus]